METKFLNTEIDPKDDFYGFATGKWAEYNPQPEDEPSWGNFDVIENNVLLQLKELFASLDENDPMQKIISDYKKVYTDYDRRAKEGLTILKTYVTRMRNETSDKIGLLKWYTTEMNSNLFCSLYLAQDMMDSTRYEVYMDQSLDLDNREYYVSGDEENVRQKYRQVMTDVLKIAGYSDSDAERLFTKHFGYETRIAQDAYSIEKLQKPEENYHRYTLDELSTLLGIDAREFLSWSGYNETYEMVVCQPEPIKTAFELINNMTLDDLRDIIEYQIVTDWCCKCSEDFGEKLWEFEQFLSGAKERSPKWKRETMHLSGQFYEPVGKIYSEKYFSVEAKNKMMEMIRNILAAYEEIIKEQTWMSDLTHERALEKLRRTGYDKIAFPDKWEDYSDFPVDVEKSYLENSLEISKWSHRRSNRKYYNKPYDSSEWPMMPQTVNACCMQQQNEICFPAGILQAPFFSVGYDDASNYGAIGVVIGHEITHNFDTSGRLFDIEGNMKDWWSEGDADKFNELTRNTIDRFDSMAAMPFLMCNGKLTLNENIADFGGLKIAYRALEKVMSDKVDEKIDGFTWQQRFFISYAQVWANVSTDEMIKQNVLNNCHSVPMVRVNGTLPMFTPWYEAFGVNSDSKLFVEEDKRAKIW